MKPPINNIIFIFSLREAYYALSAKLDEFDSSSEYAYSILSLITASVMEQESFRGTYDDSFADAINILKSSGMMESKAHKLCTAVANMIIAELINLVPDYGDDKYTNNCEYFLRNNHDVQLTIRSAVFT